MLKKARPWLHRLLSRRMGTHTMLPSRNKRLLFEANSWGQVLRERCCSIG